MKNQEKIILRNWWAVGDYNDSRCYIAGYVFGHPFISDGRWIRSRNVQRIVPGKESMEVYTKTTRYICEYRECVELPRGLLFHRELVDEIRGALQRRKEDEIQLVQSLGLKEKETCLFCSDLRWDYLDRAYVQLEGKILRCGTDDVTTWDFPNICYFGCRTDGESVEYGYLWNGEKSLGFCAFPENLETIYVCNLGMESMKIEFPGVYAEVAPGELQKIQLDKRRQRERKREQHIEDRMKQELPGRSFRHTEKNMEKKVPVMVPEEDCLIRKNQLLMDVYRLRVKDTMSVVGNDKYLYDTLDDTREKTLTLYVAPINAPASGEHTAARIFVVLRRDHVYTEYVSETESEEFLAVRKCGYSFRVKGFWDQGLFCSEVQAAEATWDHRELLEETCTRIRPSDMEHMGLGHPVFMQDGIRYHCIPLLEDNLSDKGTMFGFFCEPTADSHSRFAPLRERDCGVAWGDGICIKKYKRLMLRWLPDGLELYIK